MSPVVEIQQPKLYRGVHVRQVGNIGRDVVARHMVESRVTLRLYVASCDLRQCGAIKDDGKVIYDQDTSFLLIANRS